MKVVSDLEALVEEVLPVLITDVMHELEARGGHPEEDFADRLRPALMKVLGAFPDARDDVWEPDRKRKIVEAVCKVIEL